MRLFAFPAATVGLAIAWAMPGLFWLVLAGLIAATVLFLALRRPTAFCVVWMLLAGCSLEMTMNDWVGPEAFQSTIALVKAAEIGLAVVCALRWGVRGDPCNPAWAFGIMACVGVSHGLYPGLTLSDSLRSLVGSVAPFAFCFVRAPAAWADAVIRTARWCAIVAVAAGVIAGAIGLRPLFTDGGGMRLTGLGHPAFLATVCMAGVYAGLIRLYRTGRAAEIALLGANLSILLLTGARAPLFFASLVTCVTLIWIASPVVPRRWRLLMLLVAASSVPLLMVFMLAGGLDDIRLFNLLGSDATHLSGRDMLWDAFESVTRDSPWVGWGVGAGNVIIPADGPIAQLLHTWAAHNEYLRIAVEGGHLGRALLIGLFTVWVWLRSRRLQTAERRIIRLVFLAFAGHAFTDNLLISTPACVLLTFAAAVFAHAEEPLPDAVREA